MSSHSPWNAKVTNVEPMPTGEAKWIRLNRITYQDASGKERLWETAERQTRPKQSDCDAVGIVAILHDPTSKDGPSLLLQKQFRPPLNKVTIEVPAGLIDEGEDPSTTALRELHEETGYIGTLPANYDPSKDIVMFNDPGFCNTNTKMVFVDVDMTDERNRNPRPQMEEGEFIESFMLPLREIWASLRRLEEEGYAVDARVGTLAQGWEMARRWKGVLDEEVDGT